MTGAKFKAWRKSNGYTQESLSKALRVHKITIAKWEAGTNKIPHYIELALKGLEGKPAFEKSAAVVNEFLAGNTTDANEEVKAAIATLRAYAKKKARGSKIR